MFKASCLQSRRNRSIIVSSGYDKPRNPERQSPMLKTQNGPQRSMGVIAMFEDELCRESKHYARHCRANSACALILCKRVDSAKTFTSNMTTTSNLNQLTTSLFHSSCPFALSTSTTLQPLRDRAQHSAQCIRALHHCKHWNITSIVSLVTHLASRFISPF